MDESNARRVLEDFRLHADGLLENFTGREWLVERVHTWQTDERAKHFLLIQGAAGIGKSAFAAHLWRQRKMLAAIHFCIAGRGGTTDPLTFVETLSAQLAAAVPGFDQARRQIWEAYSRQPTKIEAQVSTGEVHPGGQVTGVSVRLTLASIDPKQAFDLLVRRPLQALSQVGQSPPTLILVDALDEAIYGHQVKPNILDLLLDTQDFPSEVRWILTSRAEPQVMEPLHALPVEVLDASLREHQDDIHAYIRARMGELETTARLWRVEVESLPERLGEKVEWNFLYLTTVWPELAAGHFTSLDDLPATLNQYYRSLLNRQIPKDSWQEWGADLMEILLALREPVDAETFAAFLGWKPRPTLQRLNRLAPLLSPALLREGRYYRHHWSLVEALRDRNQAGDWFCDLPEGHRRIAEHFLTVWGGLDAGLPLLRNIERPDYGTRHLVTHLLESGQTEHVFQLLRLAWEVAGKPVPAWFTAHERIGTPDEFARHLRQVWQAASEINHSDALQGRPCSRLGEEIRCALIEASMHSLAANLPPELPGLLVQYNHWTPRQALAYIRQMPDEGRRGKTLGHLAFRLLFKFLVEVKVSTIKIYDFDSQAKALKILSQRLIFEPFPEIFALIREIRDVDVRTQLLNALQEQVWSELPLKASKIQNANALSEEIFGEITDLLTLLQPLQLSLMSKFLNHARTIQNSIDYLLHANTRLVWSIFTAQSEKDIAHIAESLDANEKEIKVENFSVIQKIKHERSRADILIASAPRIPPALMSEAVSIAETIRDEDVRAEVLIALIEQMPEPLPEAISLAKAIKDAHARAKVLIVLIQRMPELLPEAVSAARAIKDAFARAQALTSLAEYLPELFPEALATIKQIKGDFWRGRVLFLLIGRLPSELLPEAFVLAKEIESKYERAMALANLAIRHFPEALPEALSAAREIENRDARVSVLISLAEWLPEIFVEVLATKREIYDWDGRVELLITLSPYLPTVFLPEAMSILAPQFPPQPVSISLDFTMLRNFTRVETLTPLVERLPKNLQSVALFNTKKIDKEYARGDILIALAPYLLPELLSDALSISREIQDTNVRANILIALVKRFPELYAEALVAARGIQDADDRANILIALAEQFPELWPEALVAAKEIQDANNRAQVLLQLATQFPELLPEVLSAVRKIEDISIRTHLLTELIPRLGPELMSEILCAIEEICDYNHVRATSEIIAPEALSKTFMVADKFLTNISKNKYQEWCANALIAVAERLSPELLPAAWAVARKIENKYEYARILGVLAKRFPELWTEALSATNEISDSLLRANLLHELAPHLPQQLLSRAIASAKKIKDVTWRVYALIALANRLPPALLPDALSALRELSDSDARVRFLGALAPRLLPEFLSEALSIAKESRNQYDRARAMTALAEHFPELWPNALNATRAIRNKYLRVHALIILAERFQELLSDIMSLTKTIRNEHSRTHILIVLAQKFPKLFSDVLAATKEIPNGGERTKVLLVLTEQRPEVLPELLSAISEIQDEFERARGLNYLVPRLPKELLPKALVIARKIEEANHRAEVLIHLAEHLPEVCPEVLAATKKIEREHDRSRVLTELVKYLSHELLPEFLTAVKEIRDADARAKLLIALAKRFTEILPEALALVRQLPWVGYRFGMTRAETLIDLADRIIALPRAQSYPLWAETLPVLARRTRRDLLSDLSALAPLIHALGGEQAAGETFLAIQDVARWWP